MPSVHMDSKIMGPRVVQPTWDTWCFFRCMLFLLVGIWLHVQSGADVCAREQVGRPRRSIGMQHGETACTACALRCDFTQRRLGVLAACGGGAQPARGAHRCSAGACRTRVGGSGLTDQKVRAVCSRQSRQFWACESATRCAASFTQRTSRPFNFSCRLLALARSALCAWLPGPAVAAPRPGAALTVFTCRSPRC